MFSSLSTIKNLKPSSPRLSNNGRFFGGVNIHKSPPVHAWFIVFIGIEYCKRIFFISLLVKIYISCFESIEYTPI